MSPALPVTWPAYRAPAIFGSGTSASLSTSGPTAAVLSTARIRRDPDLACTGSPSSVQHAVLAAGRYPPGVTSQPGSDQGIEPRRTENGDGAGAVTDPGPGAHHGD